MLTKAILVFAVLVLCAKKQYVVHEKNVCKTMEDYEKMKDNPNCWYNPDVTASVSELITNNGYPLEIYETTTEDGYFLTIFRIPNYNSSKGSVYLQHPVVSTASIWVNKRDKSLGFILYDSGYDVWMGTFRGSSFSRHERYSQNMYEFWNYSFHEIGVYDLPAGLSMARKHINHSKLYYVGLSIGTTAAFIYLSVLPEHAKGTVNASIMLSPAAYIGHTLSPYHNLGPFEGVLMVSLEAIGYKTLMEHEGLPHKFLKWFCFNFFKTLPLCLTLFTYTIASDFKNLNPEWYPHLFYQHFNGFSVKTGIHYVQHMSSGEFQFFDYGNKNNEIYGQNKPPLYPLENINVPMYLVYGDRDYFTMEEDMLKLLEILPYEVKKYGTKKIDGYNHLDFMYGKDVKEKVYDHVLEFLDNLTMSRFNHVSHGKSEN